MIRSVELVRVGGRVTGVNKSKRVNESRFGWSKGVRKSRGRGGQWKYKDRWSVGRVLKKNLLVVGGEGGIPEGWEMFRRWNRRV
jgi:hypothetical protein